MTTIKTISPVDGRVYVERAAATPPQIDAALAARARRAARSGAPCRSPSARRSWSASAATFEARGAEIASELTWQMGRPIRFAPERGARHARARAAT